jgi:quercetin dioxygenase-like cupin family protein
LLLAACLALATGAALVGVGTTLTGAHIAPELEGASAADAEVVGAFYEEVNEAIRTGRTAGLKSLVVPDVTWCSTCSEVQSREGLANYLLALHRIAPGARLIVDGVVADGRGTAMAHVRIKGLPSIGQSPPWGPIDTFRVAGGLITERDHGPDTLALQEALLQVPLGPLPPGVKGVAMARLAFTPGTGVDGLLSAGPTALVVEAGSIVARIAHGGRIVRADGGGEEPVEEAGVPFLLRQGDAAIIPAGVRHSLNQEGADPAEVLGVTLFYVDDERGLRPRPGPDLGVFVPPDSTGRDTQWPRPLPEVRVLANGTVAAWPSRPVQLSLGRAVLGSGGQISPGADADILLAVESGTLTVDGGEVKRVVAGTGALQPAGSDRSYSNAGDRLVALLVLSVAPEAA